MKSIPETAGVTLHESSVEKPGTIETIKRHHAPLRAKYIKIRMDLVRDTTDAECLKMAVLAVTSRMGPDVLCPILLALNVIRRPPRTTPSTN